MKLFKQRFAVCIVSAFLIGVAGPALAAKSKPRPPTDALSQSSELAEQLSENASSIDAAAFKKTMSDINALDARLAKALPPERKQALDALVTEIQSAWATGDRSALGVKAIETYKVLQEAVPRGPKTVPLQVAQLDYAGFKVNALLSSKSMNWAQVSGTVREASTWWSAIEPRASDATLKEAMDRTLLAMKEAADQKDPKVMHFAADMELILVDGLETFTAHPR